MEANLRKLSKIGQIQNHFIINQAGLSAFKLIVIILLLVLGCNTVFAVDSSQIEAVMRKFQNKYHYVAVVNNFSNKYISWNSYNCALAPSYPQGFYGDITEDEARNLVNNIVSWFYGGNNIYSYFIENPSGQESTTTVSVTQPDYHDSWQSKLAQVDSDLDKLVIYNAGNSYGIDYISKSGSGYDYAEFDGTGCDWRRTKNGTFGPAEANAVSEWNDSTNSYVSPGIIVSSYKSHTDANYCGNPPTKTLHYDDYSAWVATKNLKYQNDLTRHTGTSTCYLRLGQYSLVSPPGTYNWVFDGEDGPAEPHPVTVDEKYHSWQSPTTGSVWTSPYLFTTSCPDIPEPSRAVNDDDMETKKAWSVLSDLVTVNPQFPNETDPVISCTAPTELIYKNKDKHIVYSAAEGCGYNTGETVHGRIIINDYDPNLNMALEVKLSKEYSDKIAKLTFRNCPGQSITIDNDDTERVYCFCPVEDPCSGDWYVPFSVTAYVGEDNISFSIATVYSEELGEDAADPNEYDRMKTYRGQGEDVTFQIKTNGYECCNRKKTAIGNDLPQISKHENGDIEIYFPDIDEAYIWGSHIFEPMYSGYSPNCAFLDISISDLDENHILLTVSGARWLVYSVTSAWTTNGSASSAPFAWEQDANGNVITQASYSGGKLSTVAQAVSPSNLYRQFYYNDSGNPNRITSYTDYSGNLSRTYTVVYDEQTGRVAGTIGGSGGCSSCCSPGSNLLYTYNYNGFILTESDLLGNVIHEYEYDPKNRTTAKWLGLKTYGVPVQFTVYDTNNASSYGGAEIQDIYDYTDGYNYYLTRNILNSDGRVISKIQYDSPNVISGNIPIEPNEITASGGFITTYEYEYSSGRLYNIKTKSPEYNAGFSDSYQKNILGRPEYYASEDILVTVDANQNEIPITLSRHYYNSGNLLGYSYDWYGIVYNVGTSYSYDGNSRLSSRTEPSVKQLNSSQYHANYTTLRYDYTYHPDGRINTEIVSNNFASDTRVITTYLYDGINQPAGTIVRDYYDNILYETYSKYNGLGDVIYNIDRYGVATGKKYDSGGKVISEFTFAEPNDTTLFDNAAFNDVSGIYANIPCINQTKYLYDNNGRVEYVYKAVDSGVFAYDAPETWNITFFDYDLYGRKIQQIEDFGGLNLTTSYQYDDLSRLVKTIYPDNHWLKQVYNGRGFVVKTIEGYGSESTDPNDFIITETLYYGNGNIFKTIKGGVVIASYQYDRIGNVFREYHGDFETEYCNYIQYERNYAGDVVNQRFIDVSSIGVETVIQEIDYRYNSRGEKIEERVFADLNGDPYEVSEPNDFTDMVKLFSYDHFGNLVETVTKTDDADEIYLTEYKEEVNYQLGDHVEQNYYDLTGQLIYSTKFDCLEICYFDWYLWQNVCSVPLPFVNIDDVFAYAKNTREIYISKVNYLDGMVENRQVLADYNEADPQFYDYQYYYQNFDAGLEWKTLAAYEYDRAGRVIKITDADDNYITLEYDSRNQLTANTLWQGKHVLRLNDDSGGDPNFVPYPVRRTLSAYNNAGFQAKTAILAVPNINVGINDVNTAADKVITYTYNSAGQLHKEKEVFGKNEIGEDRVAIKEYTYDSLGRLEWLEMGEFFRIDFIQWEYTEPLKLIGYHYNETGRVDIQTDWDINTLEQTYAEINTYFAHDNQGRVTQISNASGILNRYFYDTLGRKIKEIDPSGMVTRYNFDSLGYLISTVEDDNNLARTTALGYDRIGKKTSIGSGGLTTYYDYNYLGKIDQITYPGGKVIEYGYDVEGNVTSRVMTENSESITTNYKRDALGRICYKQFSDDPNWLDPNTFLPFDEILYNAAGNKEIVACIDDANDIEFSMYSYDGLGNLVNSGESYGQFGYSISYGHDQRGLLTSLTYPNEKVVEFTRDALGRVEAVSYDGNVIVNYYYQGDKVVKKIIGNIEYTAVIDALGRIDAESYDDLAFDYGYLSHTSRLTSMNNVNYTYDTLGRVTAQTGASYTCDLLGNPLNAGEDNFTYALDNEDRVAEVDDAGGTFAQYGYDRSGRRTSKTVDDIKTYFAYDKFGNIIAEYVQDANEAVWQRDYVYGASGELIYMQLPQTTAMGEAAELLNSFCDAWLCYPSCTQDNLEWDLNADDEVNFIDWAMIDVNDFIGIFATSNRYILTDFKGSVVGIAYPGGSLTAEIAYNAWGMPSYTGDLDGLNILWNGYYFDFETGNYYLRNRYYSPLERKFVTEDPHGINPDGNWHNPFNPMQQYFDGYGLAVYAQGDPVNKFDPWGLKKCGVCGPDVTIPLSRFKYQVALDFSKLSFSEKLLKCTGMWGTNSWDVDQLHGGPGIYLGCATGDCEQTVTVNGKCYSQHAVNYYLWGVMNSLCSATPGIDTRLGLGWTFLSGDYSDKKAWALAGLKGTLNVPNSKYSSCKTSCSTEITQDFTYVWKSGLPILSSFK